MVDKKLHSWGYNKTYYHDRDALPGKNVFTELFRTIKLSEWVIVVFTKGFNRNCWGQYCQMAAFNELIENHSQPTEPGCTFLPVFIDLEEREIPNNLCINQSLSFSDNSWRDSENQEWLKLKKTVDREQHVLITDTGEDSSAPSYQRTGIGRETSIQHTPVTNPSDFSPERSSPPGQTQPIITSRTTTPAHNIHTEQGNPLALTNDAVIQDVSLDAPVQSRMDGQHAEYASEDGETTVKQYDRGGNPSMQSTPRQISQLDSQNLEEDFLSMSMNRLNSANTSIGQTSNLSGASSSRTLTPATVQLVSSSRETILGNQTQRSQPRGPPDGRDALPTISHSTKVWTLQESASRHSAHMARKNREEEDLNLNSKVPSLDPQSMEQPDGPVPRDVLPSVPYVPPPVKMEDPRVTERVQRESSSGIGRSVMSELFKVVAHQFTSPENLYL